MIVEYTTFHLGLVDKKIHYLSNVLYFFERCCSLTATVCARAFLCYENLFAHTVTVIRLRLSIHWLYLPFVNLSYYAFKIIFFYYLCIPHRLGVYQLMEQPFERPCFCDIRLRGKEKNVRWNLLPRYTKWILEIYYLDILFLIKLYNLRSSSFIFFQVHSILKT